MGKMGGCDDGENNWLIDVRIEGGLRKNLHCDTGEELKVKADTIFNSNTNNPMIASIDYFIEFVQSSII